MGVVGVVLLAGCGGSSSTDDFNRAMQDAHNGAVQAQQGEKGIESARAQIATAQAKLCGEIARGASPTDVQASLDRALAQAGLPPQPIHC
jgi:hypothetical protein